MRNSPPSFADCPVASRLIGALLACGAIVVAAILVSGR